MAIMPSACAGNPELMSLFVPFFTLQISPTVSFLRSYMPSVAYWASKVQLLLLHPHTQIHRCRTTHNLKILSSQVSIFYLQYVEIGRF
jgi:hypothetical protein